MHSHSYIHIGTGEQHIHIHMCREVSRNRHASDGMRKKNEPKKRINCMEWLRNSVCMLDSHMPNTDRNKIYTDTRARIRNVEVE